MVDFMVEKRVMAYSSLTTSCILPQPNYLDPSCASYVRKAETRNREVLFRKYESEKC